MSTTGVVESTGAAADVDLVAAVRAGDDIAFEQLYLRYHRRIRAFAQRRLHDAGRAEDVTQEAFLSALRRLRATDSDISFKPWLFEIARNATIDAHRRTSRAEEVPVDETLLAPSDRRRLVGAPAPDTEVFARERLELLSGAFDELPEVHHRALVMREFEGRSYREIAERLELSTSAVESTLFRARRRLEHEYEELAAGRSCEAARGTIALMAEGLDPGARRRRRFSRHTRRCSACRRHARELGVGLPPASGLRKRAAALLPFPLFLRKRAMEGAASGGDLASSGAQHLGSGLAERAASLLAAAALAGAGGAAIHGTAGTEPPGKLGSEATTPPAAPAAPEGRKLPAAGSGERGASPQTRRRGRARTVPERRRAPARQRRHDRWNAPGSAKGPERGAPTGGKAAAGAEAPVGSPGGGGLSQLPGVEAGGRVVPDVGSVQEEVSKTLAKGAAGVGALGSGVGQTAVDQFLGQIGQQQTGGHESAQHGAAEGSSQAEGDGPS